MEERELTAEELYQKMIKDEFERLKNLPQEEIVLTEEQLAEIREEEKAREYENKIINKIRQKYSINQELAILRQRDTKPEEYQVYFDYVEQCKAEAKSEVLNDNNTIN